MGIRTTNAKRVNADTLLLPCWKPHRFERDPNPLFLKWNWTRPCVLVKESFYKVASS